MRKDATVNYALAGALLASGLTLKETATKVGAKNANVLRVGLAKRNLTKRSIVAMPIAQANLKMVAHAKSTNASNELRGAFSDILASHVGAIAKVAVKPNLKHLKRVGEVIEPFARTAKIVHGWDASDKAGLLLEMCDAGAVIELEPAKVACGQDTPIQSVPSPAAIADVPQDTQASDSQDNAS